MPLNNSLHGRAALFYTTKRYKSFEDLNRKLTLLARKVRQPQHWLLRDECASQDVPLPKLPQKSWGRNMDSEFLEARCCAVPTVAVCCAVPTLAVCCAVPTVAVTLGPMVAVCCAVPTLGSDAWPNGGSVLCSANGGSVLCGANAWQ